MYIYVTGQHVNFLYEQHLYLGICISIACTFVPAQSDSDFMFCLQSYQGLIIDRSLVYLSYPQDRINTQVIYRFALAQVNCTRKLYISNCKQSITSLSLLAGTTVQCNVLSHMKKIITP